jgi:hypothetical protein
MSDAVTTHESWKPKSEAEGVACWHCDRGTYLVYETDETQIPRCGQCGELEQDDPAKSKPATVRRSNAKAKDKG